MPARTLVPVAAVLGVLAVGGVAVPALAGAREPTPVALARPPAAPPAPSPGASSGPDPLLQPVGVDWAADAAIRAAALAQDAQDADARAAARQARRQARHLAARYVPPTTTTTPVSTTPVSTATSSDVWVVGDSIAQGVGAAWPGTPYVLAEPGQRSGTVVPQVLAALASGGPRLLVVALGTNDSSLDAASFRAHVEAVVDAAPHCVVWATIHRPGTAWDPFNDALRAEAARSGGRLQVADWDAYADAHPQDLQADGIHPLTGTVYAQIVRLATAAATGCG